MQKTTILKLTEKLMINMMSQKSQFKEVTEFEEMIVDSIMNISASVDMDAPDFMELFHKTNPELSKLVEKVIDDAFGFDPDEG